MMNENTKLPWINGYGDGITGPSTPAVGGPTVHEQIAHRKWQLDGCKPNEYPKTLHTVISKDGETIAIIPLTGFNGEANAKFIVQACNNYKDLLIACKEAKKVIYEAINKRPTSLSTTHHTLKIAIANTEQTRINKTGIVM